MDGGGNADDVVLEEVSDGSTPKNANPQSFIEINESSPEVFPPTQTSSFFKKEKSPKKDKK